MIDYCAAQGIKAGVELIGFQDINRAYERVVNKDVRYRFVIDIASLKDGSKDGSTVLASRGRRKTVEPRKVRRSCNILACIGTTSPYLVARIGRVFVFKRSEACLEGL
jgi:hypothetical protein